MSSRLLTMKFMQRAAASSSPTSQPQPQPHSTTTQESQPPTKRQKLSSPTSTTTTAATEQSTDLQAIHAALAAEDARRSEVIEKQAEEAGETRWVLSFVDSQAKMDEGERLCVVQDGWAGIDAAEDVAVGEQGEGEGEGYEEFTGRPVGRRRFGRAEAIHRPDSLPSPSTTTPSDDDPDDEHIANNSTGFSHPTKHLNENTHDPQERSKASIRAYKKKRKAEHLEAAKLAKKRKSKKIKLNS